MAAGGRGADLEVRPVLVGAWAVVKRALAVKLGGRVAGIWVRLAAVVAQTPAVAAGAVGLSRLSFGRLRGCGSDE